jgi:hypothetical protein
LTDELAKLDGWELNDSKPDEKANLNERDQAAHCDDNARCGGEWAMGICIFLSKKHDNCDYEKNYWETDERQNNNDENAFAHWIESKNFREGKFLKFFNLENYDE